MARLTIGAIPSAGRPRTLFDEPVVIRGDRCERGGLVSAVLATSDLDIDLLDPARKAAAAAAFARMCHTLERPMQLLIRVRRLADPSPHQWRDRTLGSMTRCSGTGRT